MRAQENDFSGLVHLHAKYEVANTLFALVGCPHWFGGVTCLLPRLHGTNEKRMAHQDATLLDRKKRIFAKR